jgi:small subunit ribosomal protein S15
MMNTKEVITNDFKQHANDTGSIEVQVAALTDNINRLRAHFAAFPKDFHSKRGLMKMVGRRATFLKYLKGKNEEMYRKLIDSLKIRR